MRIPSCPSGGGRGGGGGDERRNLLQPCVDRSMTTCRPVDGRAEKNPRKGKETRESGRKLRAEKVMYARDDLNEAKTKLYIGEKEGE